MVLQVSLSAKALPASFVFAPVRPLSRVNPYMSFEISFFSEGFGAAFVRTGEGPFARLDMRQRYVDPRVDLESAEAGVGLATVRAGVRLGLRVNQHVALEVAIGHERLPAVPVPADKWPLPRLCEN